jgi:energy-coupling factor transport system ATP-binding protein
MIIVRNLAFRTLSIPELIIPPGSAALIGPNGSGKTTFLQVLAGILKPEQCSVRFNGRSLGECRIGFVNEYPDRNILFSRVSDEIASPLRFSHLPCEEISRNVELALERAGVLHLMNRRIHTLSGGEKTLVALIAATIQSPEILILDEFDSHLDDRAVDAAEQVIRVSGAESVLRCTQNMEVASRSETLVALFNGRIRESGKPRDVFSALSGTCFVPFGWRSPHETDP